MNIFKRLLRKELGETCYDGLKKVVQETAPEAVQTNKLFTSLYEHLNQVESEKILLMQQRLNTVIVQAFQVSRTYSLVFFVYLAAWFFLMGAGLPTVVLVCAIAAISALFIGKTVQFIANRCEYTDAKLIEIYRSVLEKILKSRSGGSDSFQKEMK